MSAITSSTQLQGIRAQTSINSSIDNNTMVQTGTGILMQDDCSNTFLSCNYFDNAAPGVFMDNAANMPDQGNASTPTYNTWVGPYNAQNGKWKIDGNSTTGPIKFWYEGPAIPSNTRWPRPSPPQWINPAAITSISQFNCGIIPDIIITDSTAQESLIDSTINSTLNNDSLQEYYREAYSFATMSEDSSYLLSALRLLFYQQKQLENIGLFYLIMDKLKAGEIDSALLINYSIIDGNIIEANLKIANQIMLPTLQENAASLNLNDTIALENIGVQNSFEGGPGVIKARAFLRDIVIDHHIGFMRKSQTNLFQSNDYISVFPSPLLDSQFLSIKNDNNTINKITIYDATGKLVLPLSMINNGTNINLDCSNLASGIYRIKINKKDFSLYNSTFIKLK